MATPTKLRESIIRAFHRQGLTYEQIADLLAIGRATVSRVLRRHRETGRVEPLPRGGGNSSPIRGRVAKRLVTLLENQPDLTLAEMAGALERVAGIRTSRSSVLRALRRLGFTRKKSPSSRSSATPQRTKSVGRRLRRS